MKMKLLTSAVVAAAMFAAGPVLADRGYGHGHGKKYQHHPHHHYYKHRAKHRHYHHHYYHYHAYYPQPQRYYYAPPRAGVHIVLPSIYIPLR
ncbi:MAG: hypothetical protein KIT18_03235 [Burkholderiales bacterium]|nr:hypothetical protein [Burkholderiales bacterium]